MESKVLWVNLKYKPFFAMRMRKKYPNSVHTPGVRLSSFYLEHRFTHCTGATVLKYLVFVLNFIFFVSTKLLFVFYL